MRAQATWRCAYATGTTTTGSGGSIGLSAEPIRVTTSALEAHTTNSAGGIFIEGSGDLRIGGVPNSIFAGTIRGVQTRAGGSVSISTSGNLTRFVGTDSACGPGGGSGGPICAVGGDITLVAAGLGTAGSFNRLHVNATGNVSATST